METLHLLVEALHLVCRSSALGLDVRVCEHEPVSSAPVAFPGLTSGSPEEDNWEAHNGPHGHSARFVVRYVERRANMRTTIVLSFSVALLACGNKGIGFGGDGGEPDASTDGNAGYDACAFCGLDTGSQESGATYG